MRKLFGGILASALLLIPAVAVYAVSDTGGGATSLTVDNVITLSAPAGLDFDFGNAAPGDTSNVNDVAVTVTTNNADGYTLSVQASDMAGFANGGSIPATAMSFRVGTDAYAALTAANTDLQLASEATNTDANGTDYAIDAQLVVPWVAGDAYDGTVTFTASTL